jgi:hypothetical protein
VSYAVATTIAIVVVDAIGLREASSDDRILLVTATFLLSFSMWELVFWATGGRVLRWFGDDKE